MPFQFNIEGPETRKMREAEMQERDIRTKILQRSLEKEDPELMSQALGTEMSILQDPNASPERKAIAYRRAAELGGSRQVEGLGNVPTIIPVDQINQALQQTAQSTADRLAWINNEIANRKAAGDVNGATALESTRDSMFKNAKDNFKKLPIRQAEDLSDLKAIVELGQGASSFINSRPNLYGPIEGRTQAGLAMLGASPEFTQMSSMFSGVRNQILKARSGGAVTPQEAERFIEEIGSPTSGDFAQRMEFFTGQRRREYLDKLQAYRDAGYEIPGSLMIGGREEAKGGAQQTQAGGRQVIKYTRDAQGNLVPAR